MYLCSHLLWFFLLSIRFSHLSLSLFCLGEGGSPVLQLGLEELNWRSLHSSVYIKSNTLILNTYLTSKIASDNLLSAFCSVLTSEMDKWCTLYTVPRAYEYWSCEWTVVVGPVHTLAIIINDTAKQCIAISVSVRIATRCQLQVSPARVSCHTH